MDAFYDKVLSPDRNGAAFFAVCRGKVCAYVRIGVAIFLADMLIYLIVFD